MNNLQASTEQLNNWATAYKEHQDAHASDCLMRALTPLVYKHARRFAGHDEHMLEDMVQEGYMAILHATKTFDHAKGESFFPFAATWVARSIQNYSLKNWRLIRITDNKSVKRAYTRLSKLLGDSTNLSNEQALALADELGVDIQHVRLAYGLHACKEVSANAPLSIENGAEGFCLQDLLADPESPELLVEQAMEMKETRRRVDTMLGALADREKMIIQRRIMVEEEGDASKLKDLGDELGVSLQRVKQLEAQAIKKMRAVSHLAMAA